MAAAPAPSAAPSSVSGPVPAASGLRGWRLWLAQISPLTWHILAVNLLAPLLLVASIFYVGGYEERLIAAEFGLLRSEARLVATALAEGAVVVDYEDNSALSADLARNIVRRLVEASETRTRLYDGEAQLVADTRTLQASKGGQIQIADLSSPLMGNWLKRQLLKLLRALQPLLAAQRDLPTYAEDTTKGGEQYGVVTSAATGEISQVLWQNEKGQLLLGVAVPVQQYKKVLGTILLTRSGDRVDEGLRNVQADIIQIFLVVLALTILVSLYLARTITAPISQLAAAVRDIPANANVVTLAQLAQRRIPDLGARHDELGDLSVALRGMTAALIARLTAIEHFAADVAHELKNPLTSLKSAVETFARLSDPAQQARLLAIIKDDVERLDRLITDTATASRLEAELSRAALAPVQISELLAALLDLYDHHQPPRLELVSTLPAGCQVKGEASRLMQVLTNLVDNALSFAPATSMVTISASADAKWVTLQVRDCGPGIPPNKLEAIFDRFYTERPAGEQFGRHSGLGLSIAKQIVEAHGGTIVAANIEGAAQQVAGALFTVTLPRLA